MVLPLAAIPITVTHPIHCIGSFQLVLFHDDPSKRTNLHFLAFKMLWLPLIKDGEEWVIKEKRKARFYIRCLKIHQLRNQNCRKNFSSFLQSNAVFAALKSYLRHLSIHCYCLSLMLFLATSQKLLGALSRRLR